MKILILEIDEKGKEITGMLSEDKKYPMVILFNPSDVFTMLKKEKFDIIFIPLDINGVDSLALCRQVKYFNPKSVIYAYSDHLKLYDPYTLERVGFDGFIKRTPRKETLITAVEGAMYRLLQPAAMPGRVS